MRTGLISVQGSDRAAVTARFEIDLSRVEFECCQIDESRRNAFPDLLAVMITSRSDTLSDCMTSEVTWGGEVKVAEAERSEAVRSDMLARFQFCQDDVS